MRRAIAAFVLTGAVFTGGLVAGAATINSALAQVSDPYDGLGTLARALDTIERKWAGDAQRSLIYGAIDGMVDTLDPHSVFLDPEAYGQLQDTHAGAYVGIGVELVATDSGVELSRVIPGGPAALAGMHPGDLIQRVDDQDVATASVADVAKLLRGDRGLAVAITVLRGTEPLTLSPVRDTVREVVVDAALFAPGWGYARLHHFRVQTADDLRAALARLEAEGGQPLQGLVLDLRENPGGLMDEAVAITDQFLTEGPIVETRDGQGAVVDQHAATTAPDDRSCALVVLVDGGSASASEVVAGALQARRRATIVGTATYGKGSVQQLFEFEDGSALKLTVARYHLPDGRTISDGAGVVPDVEVKVAGRRARARARVRSQLETSLSGAALEQALQDLEISAGEGRDLEPAVRWTGTLAERLERDSQLEAAWSSVRAAD